MQRATCAPNGPNHLGLSALQATEFEFLEQAAVKKNNAGKQQLLICSMLESLSVSPCGIFLCLRRSFENFLRIFVPLCPSPLPAQPQTGVWTARLDKCRAAPGTTAVVAVVQQDVLWTAHTGDSRAVLSRACPCLSSSFVAFCRGTAVVQPCVSLPFVIFCRLLSWCCRGTAVRVSGRFHPSLTHATKAATQR